MYSLRVFKALNVALSNFSMKQYLKHINIKFAYLNVIYSNIMIGVETQQFAIGPVTEKLTTCQFKLFDRHMIPFHVK